MKPGAFRQYWRVVAIVILAAVLVGMWVRVGRGPRYEGKAADYWVGQLLRNDAKARQALRTIGPAAVRPLAQALNRRRSRIWTRLEAWRPKLPAFIARRWPNRALDQLLEKRAIEMLYEFGPEAAPAVPALLGVEAGPDDFIGFGSAGLAHATLLRIGPAGLPYFIKSLGHRDSNLRAKAASYLGQLGPDAGAAAPALARALHDSHPAVRSSAVIALGQIGAPAKAAVPALRAALSSDDDFFLLQVIDALWKVGRESETTVPVLTRILRDRNNSNRAGAATLLGQMGPAAKAAAPALSDVLREPFSYTRVKAEEALRQIQAGSGENTK